MVEEAALVGFWWHGEAVEPLVCLCLSVCCHQGHGQPLAGMPEQHESSCPRLGAWKPQSHPGFSRDLQHMTLALWASVSLGSREENNLLQILLGAGVSLKCGMV